jgi:L-glyceraldehyde 3-phosphate reductase
MAQLAIAWTLRNPVITSALIGASKPEQIEDIVRALDNLALSEEELVAIEAILDQ